jgi:hypothetical protein
MAALVGVTAACDSRHSSASLRIPAGNVERGQTASPVDPPVVRVKLGGVIDQRFSDGYFISAMLNPKSQMPCYTTRMTRNK